MKVINVRYTFHKLLKVLASAFTQTGQVLNWCAPELRKGVYLVGSNIGYTVQIDDYTLDLQLSYSKASELRDYLESLRKS